MKIEFVPINNKVQPLRIKLIGNLQRAEFGSVVRSIEEIATGQIVIKEPSSICHSENDDIVFFFQEYPGQYSEQTINLFHQKTPLSSLVIVAGSLCEGEGRTGWMIPGVIRLYWRQWQFFGKKEFQAFIERKISRFSLPKTTSEEDFLIRKQKKYENGSENLFAADLTSSFSQTDSRLFWIISDNDLALRQFWTDCAQRKGYRQCEMKTMASLTRLLSDSSQNYSENIASPSRIVIDTVDINSESLLKTVEQLFQLFPKVKIDLLVFEPFYENMQRFQKFPCCRILSKPFLLDWDEND